VCGRFTNRYSWRELHALYALSDVSFPASNFQPRYNVAPTQMAPVVRLKDGGREIAFLKWGLVPSWAKDAKDGAKLINARAETAAEKPSFRGAFRHRRCPVVAAGFFLFGALGWRRIALGWLVLASLYFYAFWNVAYVPLLVGSIGANYAIGYVLARTSEKRRFLRRTMLVAAIAGNLALLGYFKYTDFAISTVDAVAGAAIPLQHIVLPLAISFFTFNQIAYIVDVYRRQATEYDVLNYAFFVSFFPHLIAGPIVHHRDIIPQLRTIPYRFAVRDVGIGTTVFAIGLFEKVVLADTIGVHADAMFGTAAEGVPLGAAASWAGVIAYALQLYFDFAGYSTCAIGAASQAQRHSTACSVTRPSSVVSPRCTPSRASRWRRMSWAPAR